MRHLLLRGRMLLLALPAIAACIHGHGEPVPTKAAIRGDGTMLVDDKPFFPVGIHTEQLESIPVIAEAGFNLASGSGEWTAEHYASANEHGLLVLGGHYVWATFASFRTGGGIKLKPSEEAGMQNVIAHARDQSWRMPLDTLAAFDHLPGVIGWRINEEPEAKLVEYMEYGYELFKSHSPQHIVATLSCDRRWYHAFRNTADVLIANSFPYRGNHRSRQPLMDTYDGVRQGIEGMDGKPVWVMPQLYPPSYWSLNPADEMSTQDMRLQSYVGLIAGAKGVIMYDYGMFGRVRERNEEGSAAFKPADEAVMKQRWDSLKTVVAELKELGPIICDGRLTEELYVRWVKPGPNGPGPQMTRELDLYGTKYLIVTNLLEVPIKGRVYGINAGNSRAYDTRVWLGEGDLSVEELKPGEPEITVGPRGTGVFVLERRPILPKSVE